MEENSSEPARGLVAARPEHLLPFSADDIEFPISIELPDDWKEQIGEISSENGLASFEPRRASGGKVSVSLCSTARIGGDAEKFKNAVAATCEQITAFLSPRQAWQQRLEAAASRAKAGTPSIVTGRELLGWFNASRRGARVVERVRSALETHNLVTEPDFNEVWVDDPLQLKLAPASAETPETSATETSSASPGESLLQPADGSDRALQQRPPNPDPMHRISRLPAANQNVVSVRPGTKLTDAVTRMMLSNYSQLPIMASERNCKGAISWESIGAARACGRPCGTVDDCITGVEEVDFDTALFEAIPKIQARGFVLIRARDKRIQGIVTVSDLSSQFRLLSEPFLLIGQIEAHLRGLISRSFTLGQLRAAKNQVDAAREVDGPADLSFGEYVRLLEPEKDWESLRLPFARGPFISDLKEVNLIRNDVMHFDPEPIEDAQLELLRRLSSFLSQPGILDAPSHSDGPVQPRGVTTGGGA